MTINSDTYSWHNCKACASHAYYGLNPPDQVHVELIGISGSAAGHSYNSGYWYWMPTVHQ